MSNTNMDILVGYNKNDFLYVLANDMPTKENCNDTYYKIVDNSCVPFVSTPYFLQSIQNCNESCARNTDGNCMNTCLGNIKSEYVEDYSKWKSWSDNSYNCLQKERCINRENAEKLYKLQNDHLGSDGKYEDTEKLYKNEYIKTFNLSIGIIGILAVLFYSK